MIEASPPDQFAAVRWALESLLDHIETGGDPIFWG
jgi:hypothetical protein